ncbi:hypothetical protein IWZ01DRAFT_530834 [Phyllosticta capitalensis]
MDLSPMKRQQRESGQRVDLSHISPTANHNQVLMEQPATHERRLPYDPGESHAHSFAQMARPCSLSSGQRINSAFRTSKINVSASTCAIRRAQVEATQSFRSEGKVQAPLTMSATTSGFPLPIEGANRAQTRSISFSFRAPGEQIFAVQRRKLRFARFSSRKVEDARLESGNRWKMYLGGRGGDHGDSEETVSVDVETGADGDWSDSSLYDSEIIGGETFVFPKECS